MTHYHGILIGLATLAIIGLFHPLVIKTEYYIGRRAWPLFLVFGVACLAGSVLVASSLASALLGVLGFSFFWSIRELFEQVQRVEQGRFPRNPKRKQ